MLLPLFAQKILFAGGSIATPLSPLTVASVVFRSKPPEPSRLADEIYSPGCDNPPVQGGSRSSSRMPWPAAVAVVATVALLALGVYVLLGFLAGNTDRYGRVAVPGTEALRLDSGEVDVFYAEDISLGEDESLAVPGDLALRIAPPGGPPLEVRRRSEQQVSGPGGTATLIGSIDVPGDGTYEIATRSATASARRDPEVTLGESPFDAVGGRIGSVVGVLIGPLGAGVLGLLALIAIVAWARSRSTQEGPTL